MHHPITRTNKEWLEKHCRFDAAKLRISCDAVGQEITRLSVESVVVEVRGTHEHKELVMIDHYVCTACCDEKTVQICIPATELVFDWRPEELPS